MNVPFGNVEAVSTRTGAMWIYDAFNLSEAALWGGVAAVIDLRAPAANRRQGGAVTVAALAFILFGLTDLLEVGTHGRLPMWLWAAKIACGATILAARYHWRGWRTFCWRDREFVFGLCCLTAVLLIVALSSSSLLIPIGN